MNFGRSLVQNARFAGLARDFCSKSRTTRQLWRRDG